VALDDPNTGETVSAGLPAPVPIGNGIVFIDGLVPEIGTAGSKVFILEAVMPYSFPQVGNCAIAALPANTISKVTATSVDKILIYYRIAQHNLINA
jgi:hypothetical protein